ncbi:hypothetical protein [Lysobacter sp. GCM10012299]|uniref:hypothetical protein n=1 Tax=Lysobacter sp. GCM10012299 TaxID=3317333 RepID=UPI003606136F
MSQPNAEDWGAASDSFDDLNTFVKGRDLASANEAQTRYDVIDRLLRDVLQWRHGSIAVEEHNQGTRTGYVDYILRSGDTCIVVEAKKFGATFPTPTVKTRLKLGGAVLGAGEIAAAIAQAKEYAATKKAQIVVVTNGSCWCLFSLTGVTSDSFAHLLFPFDKDGHAEKLFDILSSRAVDEGSCTRLTNDLPPAEERLLAEFRVSDDRVDRNNIADQISPALDRALYSEAIISDTDALRRCFITTEARTKFDSMLGMHLADPKPHGVAPAKRINREKKNDHLESIIAQSEPSFAPPVTLIIGPVGAGKSTYLKHFELIAGSELLVKKAANWIYIDMEALGKGGDPRAFIYDKLKTYLDHGMPGGPASYDKVIGPAYEAELRALKAGPLALIAKDEGEFNKLASKHIFDDYSRVEPYVDKVVTHLAKKNLAVIVLDNIDLYEDDALETAVFAEGLALSKRVHCHVIVSVRDTTFVRHKNDSAFNAYELRKLWLDPPPLKAVISARLTYSKKILEKKSATINLPNSMHLNVPDLSVFFDIVQQSILRGQAGDYVEAIADLDIRKGLSLVRNFLTSGHIEADRALRQYLIGDTKYFFPFHEIFKGTMLGQWMHFSEDRAEGINVFDSRLGSRRLRLLRAFLLQFLISRAKSDASIEVSVADCCTAMADFGASAQHVIDCLTDLSKQRLVRSTTAEGISAASTIVVTRSGGYYTRILSRKFVYVEECMYDTAIDAPEAWGAIRDLTASILVEKDALRRMKKRRERIELFLNALEQIENEIVTDAPQLATLRTIGEIRAAVLADADDAVRRAAASQRGTPMRRSR